MRYTRTPTRHRTADSSGPEDDSPHPANIGIIGAGPPVDKLIHLIREFPEFRLSAIYDPDRSLKGRQVDGIPIRGWLKALHPAMTHAVIGNPSIPGQGTRATLFKTLRQRGISLPILVSPDARVAPDVTLHLATTILGGVTVESGAHIGSNCLLAAGTRIGVGTRLPDHATCPDRQHSGSTGLPLSGWPCRQVPLMVEPGDPILHVYRRMRLYGQVMALVTDPAGHLLGIIRDLEIRRGILTGTSLNQPVQHIMNDHPLCIPDGTPDARAREILDACPDQMAPVVDRESRPLWIESLKTTCPSDMPGAVIMAGGMGLRLRPLTQHLPKPMLPVAGKPILEHILDHLRHCGFHDIAISVNYLADHIRNHVGDGRKHRLRVSYVEECNRLGTAGALSLLNPRPAKPFLVMNGDLLTDLDFSGMLQYQRQQGYAMVVGVRNRKFQIPYGVMDIQAGHVISVQEKPSFEHFINAGIYVINPACLAHIPVGCRFDMTDLIQALLADGERIGAYPVFEYWRDIGTPEDLQAASLEWQASRIPATDYGEVPHKATA